MKNQGEKFLYFLMIFLAFFQTNASSQPYYFRHYQVENGLSNNTVYFIRQDTKGFMWFATKDGLNRFDGIQFKVFRVHTTEDEKHLRTDYIYCILPANDGFLWVGAQRGLYLFNPDKERLEPVIDSLTNIYDITIDREGKMWFISNNTLCTFDLKTKSLRQFDPSRYFPATSVCLSNDGTICASTEDGFIQKFNEKTSTFTRYDVFAHSKNPASKWIQKIRPGDNRTIFIGTTSQGLKLFDLATSSYKDILTYNPDKTTIYVRDVLRTKENEYWVATETGIFIYHTETKTFTNLKKKYQDPYSLDDNAVYALFKDQEGSVWAGTFFGGVNYYAKQNTAFRKYFPGNNDNPIHGNAVREICKDQYGNLWVGTEDGGLNKISYSTGKLKNFTPTGKKNSIAYSNIHGLMADGNNLWIGTFEHGIDIMDIRTGEIKKHFSAGNGEKDLKSNFALCFYKTAAGQILIGTTNGLYYYNPKTDKFIRPADMPKNVFITDILEDHQKIIWASTNDNGVFWFDPVTHKNGHITNEVNNKNSLSNNYVNDIFEDSNNNMWFATEGGGLCCLDSERKKFELFTTKNGLPANFVFKVLEDNNKNLWASTSRGLVNFKPGFKDPVVFTRANGLLNNQFNYHSGYKDKDGRLYFGSVKGMVSFMPDEISKSSFLPPVYVTGIQVFNADITPKKDSSLLRKTIVCSTKITLPYYESSVSFDFAALSYISPEMITYQYKLEGLDKEWTTINTNRKVYFTNLSPGKYVFKIKASINDFWSDKNEKELTIIITPPIWATAWAYLIYVLIGILILSLIVSNYHKRQHEKKEKEIYESKIDFFINVAHEIRTPLTLIKGPVENILEKKENMPEIKEDLICLDRNTNRLMNLVSQILDFRQTEIKSFILDFRKVNINEILNETFLRFKIMAQKKNLNYQLILPPHEIHTLADAEALQKIFSNLIDNAVKYATKDVIIKLYALEKNADELIIKFENDGHLIKKDFAEKIFEPFYRIKEMHHQKGTGIGLTLTKSLVELHNGTVTLAFSHKNFNTFLLSLPLQSVENKKEILLKEQSLL
jgi:ligand-binding sensor domain-containing protein/signal transduction histidine kinase